MEKRKVAGVSPLTSQNEKKNPPITGGIQLQEQIQVNQPPEVCYRYWRDFSHLPKFMSYLQSVIVLDSKRSHWTVAGPADTSVEWDAEIIEDKPNERISWRTLSNAQVANAGSVQFAPSEGGRQTDVKVAMTYNPALGALGDALVKLFGESPANELVRGLRQFKETVEKAA